MGVVHACRIDSLAPRSPRGKVDPYIDFGRTLNRPSSGARRAARA